MEYPNRKINLIRLISCIAVLFYHLGLLKGGFFAVCTFFVLSGFLSCMSAFKNDKFSFKDYYINKLKKLYLPLLFIVFITIAVISFFPNIIFVNLKPESMSVLLGYNNCWQLKANLDYFSQHVNSPFIHLWYIAILLQFDLVFPFLFALLKKSGEKINKWIPSVIVGLLTVSGFIYFIYLVKSADIMHVYYGTFSRVFSIIFGVAIAFIYHYFNREICKLFKNNIINNVLFYLSLIGLISLCFINSTDLNHIGMVMILVTIITGVAILVAVVMPNEKDSFINKIIGVLSSICYEVYLFQYPVIFLFQELGINSSISYIFIIIITLILSYLLHYSLSIKKENKNMLRYLLLTVFFAIVVYGIYQLIIGKDYTKDIKELENQLAENEKILESKQQEYLNNSLKEEEEWQSVLEDLNSGEEELKKHVSNLSIVGIGDSIMLGAVDSLYKQFPNGYFDAKISRTDYAVAGILNDLNSRNMFGDILLLNLGANGDCGEKCKIEIMEKCKDKKVFWVNVTNDAKVGVNKRLNALAEKYSNLTIVDWETISKGHSEYFSSDHIHLVGAGQKAFANAIYDAIYKTYLDEYNTKRAQIINEHEEKEKSKITFYGNSILLNAYDYIKDDFSDAKFEVSKELDYDSLIALINKAISSNNLTYKMVFGFDNNSKITADEFRLIFDLCQKNEIYFITTNRDMIDKFNDYDNVKIIDFAKVIEENKDYVFVDKVHLTETGNLELKNILDNELNKKTDL